MPTYQALSVSAVSLFHPSRRQANYSPRESKENSIGWNRITTENRASPRRNTERIWIQPLGFAPEVKLKPPGQGGSKGVTYYYYYRIVHCLTELGRDADSRANMRGLEPVGRIQGSPRGRSRFEGKRQADFREWGWRVHCIPTVITIYCYCMYVCSQ